LRVSLEKMVHAIELEITRRRTIKTNLNQNKDEKQQKI